MMSHRRITSLVVIAAMGIACISTDAFAARAARGGAVAARGGYYGGRYYRPGVGAAAVGAAAVGAAAASPYYYGTRCGYAPYPPCY